MRYLLIIILSLFPIKLLSHREIGLIPRYFPFTNTGGYTFYFNLYEKFTETWYINPYFSYSNFTNIFEHAYLKFDVNKHYKNIILGGGAGLDNLPTFNITRFDIHINIIYKWN